MHTSSRVAPKVSDRSKEGCLFANRPKIPLSGRFEPPQRFVFESKIDQVIPLIEYDRDLPGGMRQAIEFQIAQVCQRTGVTDAEVTHSLPGQRTEPGCVELTEGKEAQFHERVACNRQLPSSW